MKLKLLIPSMLLLWSVGKAQTTTTLTFTHNQPAQLTASAGADQTTCVGDAATLGGTPTGAGGTSPFTYAWTPTTDLSSSTVANPDATPTAGPATQDYSVTVTDDRGCTAMDTMTLTIDTCTSVAEIADLGSVVLFPNPNNGVFSVDLKLKKNVANARFTVMSQEGKVVYDRSLSAPAMRTREEIKLTNVSKGVYHLKIELDGESLTQNVIIQ